MKSSLMVLFVLGLASCLVSPLRAASEIVSNGSGDFLLIDNSADGSDTGDYTETVSFGGGDAGQPDSWNGDRRWNNGGTDDGQATYSFSRLPASQEFSVYASWRNEPQGNLGNAGYSVNGGAETVFDQAIGTLATPGNMLLNDGANDVAFVMVGTGFSDSNGDLIVDVFDRGPTQGDFIFADAVTIPIDLEQMRLTLEVNTGTGATRILNNTNATDIELDYYKIESAAGSLDVSNWSTGGSLEDQGVPGWLEGGSSNDSSLVEANLTASSNLAPTDSLSLGSAYDTGMDAQDLVFSFLRTDGLELLGTVEYVTTLLGDMNDDGSVNELDVNPFVQALTDRVAFDAAHPTVDADVIGDMDGSGAFNLGDVALFKAAASTSGAASAQGVPEPTMSLLLSVGLVALAARRRRK